MATVVSYLCLMTVSADVAACHFLWQTLDIFMSSFDPAIKTPQLLHASLYNAQFTAKGSSAIFCTFKSYYK